ncbi:hypothetical protein FACS18942_09880 [Planctomycetales bacterium]|nr:hypothetical protein FACS18942_09880 [Planctomycetales bacterium]
MSKKSARISMNYDALTTGQKRRRAPNLQNAGKTEDNLLNKWRRMQGNELIRDVLRNSALLNFAVNKHVSYVSQFCFTGNEFARREYERFENGCAENQSLQELVSQAEYLRTVDGDCFIVNIGNGQCALIEGRQVCEPDKNSELFPQGIDKTGSIAVKDDNNNFEYFTGYDIFQLAYRKYPSQVRGVSPLLSGINQFIDIYESVEYALQKAKISQLVGFITNRSNIDVDSNNTIDFSDGFTALDLGIGESASFITANTPPQDFREFMQQVGALGFAALDLPYSFYAGDATDEEMQNYLQTTRCKQPPLIRMLRFMFDKYLENRWLNGSITEEQRDIAKQGQFIGVTFPQNYLLKNIDALAKAKMLGLINDENLLARFGVADEPNSAALPENAFVHFGIK